MSLFVRIGMSLLLCPMQTINEIFTGYKQSLSKLYSNNEAEALTLMVISEVSGLSKGKIKAFPELEILDDQAEKLNHILNELKTGKPIQYILGSTDFYGLTFKVNSSVLIPRPETEELVEWIIESAGNDKSLMGNILDIGTGSGCIAISLKKNLPGFSVSAIDVSGDALMVAKENAGLNEVVIDFIQADILNLKTFSSQISIIVSNPPYVTETDKVQMHLNVTDFEPHTALFVPEDDPLIFYSSIANFALEYLQPNGLLFFEINENYGKETVKLLSDKGFKSIRLRQDISGRDRMIKAAV